MDSVNRDLYVLDIKENGRKVILSDNPEFFNSMGQADELYHVFENIPFDYDITDIKKLIDRNAEEIFIDDEIELTDYTLHYYNQSDILEVKDCNIINRVYDVYPMYMDDCTFYGDKVSETDQVQFLIHHPTNGSYTIQSDYNENLQNFGNSLVNEKFVDHECQVAIHWFDDDKCISVDPIVCEVNNGQFIIPATIVPKEEK